MLMTCHDYHDSHATSNTCDRLYSCISRMLELPSRATTFVPTLDSQRLTKHACRRAHMRYADMGI
jgi:hypothetical protein